MTVRVQFWSYFKELAGCDEVTEDLPVGATIEQLLKRLHTRFPKLAALKNSTLIAVGVEYQNRQHVLHENDTVSLFPPVQGG